MGVLHPATYCPDCNDNGMGATPGRINRSRNAVEVAERFADGEATAEELHQARFAAHKVCPELGSVQFFPVHACDMQIESVGIHVWARHVEPAILANVIREICGNPFRPVKLREVVKSRWPNSEYLISPSYLIPDIVGLGRMIYKERCWERLGELADALERAGCPHDVPCHCRILPGQMMRVDGGAGEEFEEVSTSPHVRGCWALDLLLGRT